MLKEGDNITCGGNEFIVLNIVKGFMGSAIIALNPKTNDRHELAISDVELCNQGAA